MDEPTSVLTPQEADVLFVTLRRLSSEGVAILYITHRLSEVLAHRRARDDPAPRQAGGDRRSRSESAKSLARMMVGADVAGIERPGRADARARPRLVLDKLSLPPDGPFATALVDIDLTVHGGEVIGIAGVAGNGQQEFFAAISGERRVARRRHDRASTAQPVGPARRQCPPAARRRLRAGGAHRPRRRARLHACRRTSC